jgi:hypothetical protein
VLGERVGPLLGDRGVRRALPGERGGADNRATVLARSGGFILGHTLMTIAWAIGALVLLLRAVDRTRSAPPA